jgi:hypothetical protein
MAYLTINSHFIIHNNYVKQHYITYAVDKLSLNK